MSQLAGTLQYNSIRKYLEHIYLYGFFSREDWAAIGVVKDYDKMLMLLRELYPELYKDVIQEDRRKYLRFQRKYAGSIENRLVNTYLLHALNNEEMGFLLHIASFIGAAPRSIQGTIAHMQTLYVGDESDNAWYHKVRRKLKELEDYGYARKSSQKTPEHTEKVYSLRTDDGLGQLEEEELSELYTYAQFAAGTTFPRVAGSYLVRTISRRLGNVISPSPILLRHCNKRVVFDEDILYQVLGAIQKRQRVSIQVSHQQVKQEILPIRVRYDSKIGRWYLLSINNGEPAINRLSSIQKLTVLESVEPEVWSAAVAKVTTASRYTLFSGDFSATEPTLVEAELRFDKQPGLYEQFRREMRIGEIIKGNEKTFYQAKVSDPQSVVPFLRSYAPWIRVLPGEHGIDKKIQADLLQIKTGLEME